MNLIIKMAMLLPIQFFLEQSEDVPPPGFNFVITNTGNSVITNTGKFVIAKS